MIFMARALAIQYGDCDSLVQFWADAMHWYNRLNKVSIGAWGKVQGARCKVQGARCKVQGARCRVQFAVCSVHVKVARRGKCGGRGGVEITISRIAGAVSVVGHLHREGLVLLLQ